MNSKDIFSALKSKQITPEEAKIQLAKMMETSSKIDTELLSSEETNKDTETIYDDEKIAIIGMTGRYPDANGLDEYWQNLSNGKNCVHEIPSDRFNVDDYYDWDMNKKGKIYCRWMGSLDNIKNFDASFFNISSQEAKMMDPQHRIFLQQGYKAFEDAGYNRQLLANRKCGVYLGIGNSEYTKILSENDVEVINSTGNNSAIAAARIAYYLNLRGPAISIDTACSSSLVATHIACQSLLNGEIDMALVGGVSLYLTPDRYISMCSEKMLSPDGKCKAFDNNANGFVPGEGVGALVLKRLKDAKKDNDFIHGLIIGSGINQNGNTNGITAPCKSSQIQLEKDIYNKYKIDPETIGYAELHGTGTKLGDIIELDALKTVFRQSTNQKKYCAIGSVKSNIGHTSAVSGTASLQKVLLCLKHQKLVPTLNCKEANEQFDFENSPFYINKELKSWVSHKSMPRRACVSSLGFSGSNAHIVLEEYSSRLGNQSDKDSLTIPKLFVLSAKSDVQLKEYAKKMIDFIESKIELSLPDMTYTLQVGREAMNYRLAYVTDTKESLIKVLKNFSNNKIEIDVFTNILKKDKDNIIGNCNYEDKKELYIQNKDLQGLARLWVEGIDVDWNRLYKDGKPHKISLPTYPFAKKCIWINGDDTRHNKIDANINDCEVSEDKQIIKEIYRYDEPFLYDHMVDHEPVLIGMTHASLGINEFFNTFTNENCVHLHKLNFIKPITVKKGQEVEVGINSIKGAESIDFEAVFRYDSADNWNLTATGTLRKTSFKKEIIDIKNIISTLNEVEHFDNMYTDNPVIKLGDTFKNITNVYSGQDKVLAKVSLDKTSRKENHTYVLNPLIIYTGFQTVIPLVKQVFPEDGFLPFGIKEIYFQKTEQLEDLWVFVKLQHYSEEMMIFDTDIMDDQGQITARFVGCTIKRMRSAEKTAIAKKEKTSIEIKSLHKSKSVLYPNIKLSKIQNYLINKLDKITNSKIDSKRLDMNLMDLGVDSVQLIKLTNQIEKETHIDLNPSLFFEYPNIKELTKYFAKEHEKAFIKLLGGDSQDINKHIEKNKTRTMERTSIETVKKEVNYNKENISENIFSQEKKDIAVIGINGMFAGASDVDEFWDNLITKKDVITEIPIDHWDYRPWYDENPQSENKTYCKWGGFIENVDKFDADFFNISPREAEWIDPQLRLLLQNVYATGEDAGYINKLKGTDTGVFIGVCSHDYMDMINENNLSMDPYVGTGNSQTIIANRVSYFFNLKGPSIAIDTACSSSLFALHSACHALRNGECSMAFVGGVNLLLSSWHYRYFSSIGALSPTGRCHTFDEAADGYIPGECVASILLKPLEQAKRDGDRIYAVVKGSAALHGGYTPSITAPSVEGEENVMIKAWQDAGIEPETISYIEAHGTGTKLGDPIELNSLMKAFKRFTHKERFCAVGSCKANIGHTEGAAGIAGIIKVILQMKNKQIPALPKFKKLNPYIKMDNSAIYINNHEEEWKNADGVPRRAGISSFGMSGAYAHIVMEEYITEESPADIEDIYNQSAVIMLTAKNQERLYNKAEQLLRVIRQKKFNDSDLKNIAYTLSTKREMMNERLGIITNSIKELGEKLVQVMEHKSNIEDVYRGAISDRNEIMALFEEDEDTKIMIDSWIMKKKYKKLISLWVMGADFDLERMYADTKPQLVSLPTYPFAEERYWIPIEQGLSSTKDVHISTSFIHPMVHQNTSDLSEQRFSTTFTGNEFYLMDHKVNKQKVLPGVAYLEMVNIAANKAISSIDKDSRICIENVVWIRPIIIENKNVHVHIGVYPKDNGEITYEVYSFSEEKSENCRIVYSRGNIVVRNIDEINNIDLQELKNKCNENFISGTMCYDTFSSMGMDYGPSYQGIEKIYAGNKQVIAKLSLPDTVCNTEKEFMLHPSLMDSALQSSIAFMIEEGESNVRKAVMPFSLEEIDIIHKTEQEMFAVLRYSDDISHKGINKFDIQLCDIHGRVCVSMKGVSCRVVEKEDYNEPLMGETMLVPVWDTIKIKKKEISPVDEGQVVIISGDKNIRDEVLCCYPKAGLIDNQGESTVQYLQKELDTYDSIKHIIWIAPINEDSIEGESLILDQKKGVIQLFRTIKALINLGYEQEELKWSVITTKTQPIYKNDVVNPTHGGVYGLMGSLAKEYSNWNIQAMDLEENNDIPINEIFSLPMRTKNDVLVNRNKEWYRQKLVPLQAVKIDESKYKNNGVYVVIGGAGGIGEVWSEYVIRNYKAQVIWIGRRKKNEDIQSKIDRLAKIGAEPHYISADARIKNDLINAYNEIKTKYSQINGIVHAAIALQDQTLVNMEEAQFMDTISAKIDISVRMAQVFKKERLDFVLFFSSMISFIKSAGQSNYASGCTFKDGFAHQLSLAWQCEVKVINWGYWGSVGVVASEEYQKRMARLGIDSIEPPEAMKTLEILLSNEVDQIGFVKTTKPLEMDVDTREAVTILDNKLATSIDGLRDEIGNTICTPKDMLRMSDYTITVQHLKEMDNILCKLLLGQLQSINIFSINNLDMSQFKNEIELSSIYARWLAESFALLERKNYITYDKSSGKIINVTKIDLDNTWKEWECQKILWLEDPNIKARVILVETMLRNLPQILSGEVKATDKMFPDSSMKLVEGVYKNNFVVDYFNEVLADSVIRYIEERINQLPCKKIRIMEIGAGTGGTTRLILRKLKKYEQYIREYCYTDISKAFLLHAEKEYGSDNPYLTYQLFNVEQSPFEQDISIGQYDIVIAANVLHATKDIRVTLRNAKAVLHKDGLIILNELAKNSVFAHLTFGLLDGWWLYEDVNLRIPGCPGLYNQTWKRILEEEGFSSVFFPVSETYKLEQQIIIGVSNGVIRKKSIITDNDVANSNKNIIKVKEKPRVKHEIKITSNMVRDKAEEYMKKLVGDTLKLPSSKIDSSRTLESYGIDSILVIQLTNALRKDFKKISSTLFFEFNTIDAIIEHFIETRKEDLMDAVGLKEQQEIHEEVNISNNNNEQKYDCIVDQVNPIKTRPLVHSIKPSDKYLDLPADNTKDIAIIGLAGRYAGADNINELWENLKLGKNCITEIPKERWNFKDYYCEEKGREGFMYTKWGGFIKDIDKFSPLFFKISPAEAEKMDPQERLFLETVYNCIEEAGYTPKTICDNKKVGVFVGVMNGNYPSGSIYWSIANRISYLMNFKGPSMAVDTACSSSLTAIHLALESIHSGSSECAIVGGVNLIVNPNHIMRLTDMTMLSSGNECKAFGDGADGFIDGEGVGAIILKPLAKAIDDRDHIYGIIKGSTINSGGKTNGYTVPNPNAQAEVIGDCLKRTGVNSRTVTYIEAHGTGTALGDPIEIHGLTKAFEKETGDKNFCSIGSIKSNIGHCEGAAGIVGITKVLLQMKYSRLVPSLHSNVTNHEIDFANTPFVIQHELAKWERPVISNNGVTKEYPRIAGVSSFGAGGANAHVIIEEYIPEKYNQQMNQDTYDTSVMIVLSAKNENRLKSQAKQLLNSIKTGKLENLDLVDIAYTLQVGREPMEERLGFVIRSMKELEYKLENYIKDYNDDGVYRARIKRNKNILEDIETNEELQTTLKGWIKNKSYIEIIKSWIIGLDFDWNILYENIKPKRVSLPTYPFDGERYWIKSNEAKMSKVRTNNICQIDTYSDEDNFYEHLIDEVISNKVSISRAVQEINNY